MFLTGLREAEQTSGLLVDAASTALGLNAAVVAESL